MDAKILIIDDEPMVIKALGRLLEAEGADVTKAISPIEAFQIFQSSSFDLVISDQRMPLMSGTELLAQFRSVNPQLRTILMSSFTDFDEVVAAFNTGVVDHFLPKPWEDGEVCSAVERVLEEEVRRTERDEVKESAPVKDKHLRAPIEKDVRDHCGLLSRSPSMWRVFDQLERAAMANMPVFIFGETGTGKEMSAKSIHLNSSRAEEPFVSFNCANFTDSLMVSQLFGHKKGAFTGAVSDQKGLLAEVGSGTLFLDEITSLELGLQAKLLRVLQEREYSVVGSHQLLPFKGQIVSASSQSLKSAVEEGIFREDLRYRLEVIGVDLPPLRERPEDILFLFKRFFSEGSGGEHATLSPDVASQLQAYHWPGNVRQLHNAAMYAAAMGLDDQVNLIDLPWEIREFVPTTPKESSAGTPSLNAGVKAADIDEETVVSALEQAGGNKSQAARSLGVSRMTLWRLIKKYHLDEAD